MNAISKILIFYFSGTGNSAQIAVWISELAGRKNIECQIFNIAKTEVTAMGKIDPEALLIVISPIHGFNYPNIVLKFISRFPKGKNRIVLMNTRAGMKVGKFVTPGLTGIAFMLSSLILRVKGYRIQGQIPFDMPSNWISIHPALNEKTITYICKKNHERLEKHCHKILAGKRDFHAYRDLIQDILIAPISFLYYFAGRFFIAKSFYASVDCDNCGLCIKNCPVNAIKELNGHPYWTFGCESCMQCINSCPKKAIETAHGLIILVAILHSAIMTALSSYLLKFIIESEVLSSILTTIIFLALIWLFYIIQHPLLRIKFISRIISLASFTHYKWWGRYKLIPEKKGTNKTEGK